MTELLAPNNEDGEYMELREYQIQSKEAIKAEWQKGFKRTLLVLPTGCG